MTRENKEALRAWIGMVSVANAIEKGIDSKFRREFGISISRFDVMAALHRAGKQGLRASELSKQLLVTDGATTQVTAPLVRDGLVRRAPCPDDGRAAIFTLTARGKETFANMAELHQKWIAKVFADFSPAQVKSLRSLMGRVNLDPLRPQSEKDAA